MRAEGERAGTAPLKFWLPNFSKGSPLWYNFTTSVFGWTTSNSSKIFKGGASAEKTQFFCTNFPKSALKRFFFCLFWQNRVLVVFSESSENQIDRHKKRSAKLLHFFLKNRPLEKFLRAHATELKFNIIKKNKNSTSKDFKKWIMIQYNQLKLIIFLLIKIFENKLKIIDYNRLYWDFFLLRN